MNFLVDSAQGMLGKDRKKDKIVTSIVQIKKNAKMQAH